jgi:hypothetical protein
MGSPRFAAPLIGLTVLVPRIQLATRAWALFIDAATDLCGNFTIEGNAAHRRMEGSQHRTAVRIEGSRELLGHGTPQERIRLAPIERDSIKGATGATPQTWIVHSKPPWKKAQRTGKHSRIIRERRGFYVQG